MNNCIREIVTKAIVGKGKKLIRIKNCVTTENAPYSILGCWIINHNFNATLDDDFVCINGSYEINIWYSYDNNKVTELSKEEFKYNEIIKTRQIINDIDRDSRDVIVRTLQQPTCVNACINENGVEIEVVLELLAEVIGEATMIVTVYPKEEIHEEYDDDFENEINENFIFEKQEDSALE